jgi:thiol-disulfide isomerase/thioredoxin
MVRSTLTLAAALATTAACWAGDLQIGAEAPPTDISHVLKGEAIEEFENGKIYVLEFWATWCGPCRTSMPHISELQEHYKDYDVTFIGISDEPVETVQTFIDKPEWDKKTRYTIAVDPDKSAYQHYMGGTGSRGIPTAFIVGKDGRLEWYGHPMEIDTVIEAVVKDTWDRDNFKQVLELRTQLQTAMREGNNQEAMTLLNKLAKVDPANAASYSFTRYRLVATTSDDAKKIKEAGEQASKAAWDDAQSLNMIAWFTVDEAGVNSRDLKMAMKAAKRADELSDGKNAAILDTVARIYHDQGHLKDAIAWQKKAVAAAGEDSPMSEQLRKVLMDYESQKK